MNISTNFFDGIQTDAVMQSDYNNNNKDMQIHIRKKHNKKTDNLNHTKILLNNSNFKIF